MPLQEYKIVITTVKPMRTEKNNPVFWDWFKQDIELMMREQQRYILHNIKIDIEEI